MQISIGQKTREQQNKYGETALYIATKNRDKEMVKLLNEASAK